MNVAERVRGKLGLTAQLLGTLRRDRQQVSVASQFREYLNRKYGLNADLPAGSQLYERGVLTKAEGAWLDSDPDWAAYEDEQDKQTEDRSAG